MNSSINNLKANSIHALTEEMSSVGNVRALLAEIAECLEKLINDGTTGSIDLKGLPLSPGEYEQLRRILGQGEVSAHIEAIGPSEIIETGYPGVWWVTHFNVEGDIVADMIEVTHIPEILKSQPDDIIAGLAILRARLNDEVRQ